jgi:hypothetical protein
MFLCQFLLFCLHFGFCLLGSPWCIFQVSNKAKADHAWWLVSWRKRVWGIFFILCFFYACMFLFHVKKLDDYVYYCFVDISDFVYFYTTVRESSTWSKMKEIFWSSLTSFCRYLCSMKVEYRAYEVGSWKTLCINYKIWLFREADLIFHNLDKIKPHGFDALIMVVYLKSKKWDDMINFFILRLKLATK